MQSYAERKSLIQKALQTPEGRRTLATALAKVIRESPNCKGMTDVLLFGVYNGIDGDGRIIKK